MRKKERAIKVIEVLKEKFGKPKCALNYKTPFELLVAVILSAQCTDVRVNIVTEKMFQKVNTPEEFANLPVEEIEETVAGACWRAFVTVLRRKGFQLRCGAAEKPSEWRGRRGQ